VATNNVALAMMAAVLEVDRGEGPAFVGQSAASPGEWV
jgi:hypothetical protein